jgi:VanZ family protein
MVTLITFLRPFAKYVLALWVITIITVSSIPHLPVLKLNTSGSEIRLDYLIHFCEYGFLAFLAYLSFTGKDFRTNRKRLIIITLALIFFSLADEYHQILIPGRTFNVKDILSNLGGILAAYLFSIVIFRKIKEKSD